MTDFIPVYSPTLGKEELVNVTECLTSTWISSKGRFIDAFEKSFAKYVAASHAICVCNGTVALHLALAALGIGPGDKVAVPSFTYIASVNAIHYVGAEPVFIDCDPVSLQLCPHDFESKASQVKLAAVMLVHLYGQACELERITAIAKKLQIKVVEDCAEAFGTRIGNDHVGNLGDVATYSFFGNKTITTGEGGMVTTNSPDIAAMLRKLRGQGLADDREYWHDVVGFNYRMTNICAAIGLAQLDRADETIARKRAIADYYRVAVRDTPLQFHDEVPGTTHSFWMCSVLTPVAEQRDALRQHLRSNGIDTRPFFHPAHTMPMYRRFETNLPVTVDVASRGMNLPSFPGLTGDQLERIGNCLREFYQA